jgi:L-alanine-DL-glutamate epimerase-like enolase superfamily enzyme
MKITRRKWLKLSGSAVIAASLPRSLNALVTEEPLIRDFEAPMFNIPGQISSPVIIESVELLKNGSNYFVRTRSKDGAEGLVGTKQIVEFIPIFQRLVAPHFIGKDARDIESLVDSVYRANYKLAGIPFWCPVAYVEQSLQFAACTKNAAPYMEYPWRRPQTFPAWYKPDFKIIDGKIKVPATPGMGLEIDPDYIRQATSIAKIDPSVTGNSSTS